MNFTIKLASVLITFFVMTFSSHNGNASSFELAWEVEGFKNPESVVYDRKRKQFYVSNINDGVTEKDGNGSIGLISHRGEVLEIDWVEGLNSPKGLALSGRYLYAADVGELVVINVDTATIVARYYAPDSLFLNDVTLGPNGRIYVSDIVANRIYFLNRGELQIWLESEELESPNGLYATYTGIYVGSWGPDIQPDFSTTSSGSLKFVSFLDKSIHQVDHSERWMNLDGIARINKRSGWFATDYFAGELLQFDADGYFVNSLTLDVSSADLTYVPNKRLIVIPFLNTGKVVAYTH